MCHSVRHSVRHPVRLLGTDVNDPQLKSLSHTALYFELLRYRHAQVVEACIFGQRRIGLKFDANPISTKRCVNLLLGE